METNEEARSWKMTNEKYRNQKILDSAKGELCTLNHPLYCQWTNETVVWCHSNYLEDGKGKSTKSHDILGFYGCAGCHKWYDEMPSNKEEKRDYFHRAMKKSLLRLLELGVIK